MPDWKYNTPNLISPSSPNPIQPVSLLNSTGNNMSSNWANSFPGPVAAPGSDTMNMFSNNMAANNMGNQAFSNSMGSNMLPQGGNWTNSLFGTNVTDKPGWLDKSMGWIDGKGGTHKGIVPGLAGFAANAFNTWMNFKLVNQGEQQLDFQRDSFAQNMAAQKQAYNDKAGWLNHVARGQEGKGAHQYKTL